MALLTFWHATLPNWIQKSTDARSVSDDLQMGGGFQDLARNLSGMAGSVSGGTNTAAQVAATELLASSIDEWLEAQPYPAPLKELPSVAGSTAKP